MRDSLIYLLVFALGIVLALVGWIPELFIPDDMAKGILYLLLFFVGIQIGSSTSSFRW